MVVHISTWAEASGSEFKVSLGTQNVPDSQGYISENVPKSRKGKKEKSNYMCNTTTHMRKGVYSRRVRRSPP